MPKGLRRYYGRGELHFVTFSCYRRLPLLGTARARTLFLRELARVRREYQFCLVGYVVMPEHVHLLMGEPKKGTPSTVLQMLKQRVSRKMRKKKGQVPQGQLRIPFPRFVGELSRFWQERFYDFNVYSRKKEKEKLDYMHANPVNRELVKHPGDWPWSSWGFYFREGQALVPIDVIDPGHEGREEKAPPSKPEDGAP
jgi:putative transposase